MPAPDWFAKLLPGDLTAHQAEDLYRHYELLIRWNERMNLTTVEPGPEMVTRHYLESLFFAAHLPAAKPDISILDVGSGAGFPGVPMAVARPSWTVTLVESNQRKAVFLRESTRRLKNVHVLASRIEDIGSKADWLVARAVDPREVLKQQPRLAPNVGLLLGEHDFSAIRNEFDIAWGEPVRLPWGDQRLCVYGMFHVERST
ncbi:MAG TPA: 16S rRNA (guanine(527)-N(7))-methyltransferase RsmG [Bryobacteraceae bacterium]|nr:16S rRNA (guanine(527)-N(7))-methyltransferase RsmG [Bryobacteraceae bacterium]